MAFQQRGSSNQNRSANVSAASAAPKRTTIFKTGLFAPTREGVKSLGSIQLKEDVVLPAGSYINLYHNTDKKNENSPEYTVAVTEGKLKAAGSMGRK